MWQKIVVVVGKTVKNLMTEKENFRDLFIAFILIPLIPLLLVLIILALTKSATAQYNSQALSFLFGGRNVPSGVPTAVSTYYSTMSGMFDKLSDAWESILGGESDSEDEQDNAEDDETNYSSLTDLAERELLMKISFYMMNYDKELDSFSDEDYERFAMNFASGDTVPDIFNELEDNGFDTSSMDKETFLDIWNHSYSYAIDWGSEETSIDWAGWNEGRIVRTVFFEEGEIGEMVVQYAMTRLGDPYSPQLRGRGNYVDCSYLTMWAYAQVGITIPAVEGPQAQMIYDNGLEITYDQLQPGDLIFWSYKPWNSFRSITHTGIYAGDGMVIHASSGQKKVVLVPLFDKDKIKMYGRPY